MTLALACNVEWQRWLLLALSLIIQFAKLCLLDYSSLSVLLSKYTVTYILLARLRMCGGCKCQAHS